MPLTDWHPQDWLIVIDALVAWAGPDAREPRERRAWELAVDIAEDLELDIVDAVLQSDRNYDGPSHRAGEQ